MTRPAVDEKAPFTFKLLVGATAVYLLLRLVQGIAWLIDWLR